MIKLERPIYGWPQKGLRVWMMSAMGYFYRKVEVEMPEKPPLGKKPILFASNHQNAFMDALVVIATCGTVPSFLTRADIFQSPIAFKVLKFLRMLPIYRQRDGKDSLQRNEEVFDMCVTLLKENDNMGIFPEGNHGRRPRLRPLKKGLARIALEAEARNNFELDVQIIPVGLHYSEHTKGNSDVMVSFGEAISAKKYQKEYEENPVRTLVSLTNEIRSVLEPLIIHIPNQKHLDSIEALRIMFGDSLLEDQGKDPRNLHQRLKSDQELIAKLDDFIKSDEEAFEEIADKLAVYRDGIYALKVSDELLATVPFSSGNLVLATIGLILSFPLYLYGLINNFVLDWLANKALLSFKDDHFHASILMVARMFLKPILYTVQGGIAWALSGNIWVALGYVLSIEISRRIYHSWGRAWKRMRDKWKVQQLIGKKSTALEKMLQIRGELKNFVNDVISGKKDPIGEKV